MTPTFALQSQPPRWAPQIARNTLAYQYLRPRRAVLLAVSLSAAMLVAGCGGGDNPSKPNAAGTASGSSSNAGTTNGATPGTSPGTTPGTAPNPSPGGSSGTSSNTGALDGTSSGTGTGTAPRPPLQPITQEAAIRLINQATFGAREADIEPLRQMGRLAWIRNQYTIPVQTTHWDTVLAAIKTNPNYNWQMQAAAYKSYITAPDQLRKRVGAALLEILVVSDPLPGVVDPTKKHLGLAAYVDWLEANAFGNFRNVLGDIARSPAMGAYLTYNGNNKATYAADGSELTVPDENFARELMQLFTIGLHQLDDSGAPRRGTNGKPIETFNQSDVSNLARVFTGFSFDNSAAASVDEMRRPMKVTAGRHSPEPIKFLTASIPAGTSAENALKIALDTLFAHSNTGPFISRQLIQRLVTSNPSPGYVSRVAAKFNNNGSGVRGDMRAVIEAILLDNEATADAAPTEVRNYRGKPREPMFRLTAAMRALGMNSTAAIFPIADTGAGADRMGQTPLGAPSVFNFYRPDFIPANSELSAQKLTVPEFQTINGAAIPTSINYLNKVIRTANTTFNAPNLAPLNKVAADAPALVQKLNLLLTASTLDAASKTEIVSAVAAIPAADTWKRISLATMLITSSPAFLIQK